MEIQASQVILNNNFNTVNWEDWLIPVLPAILTGLITYFAMWSIDKENKKRWISDFFEKKRQGAIYVYWEELQILNSCLASSEIEIVKFQSKLNKEREKHLLIQDKMLNLEKNLKYTDEALNNTFHKLRLYRIHFKEIFGNDENIDNFLRILFNVSNDLQKFLDELKENISDLSYDNSFSKYLDCILVTEKIEKVLYEAHNEMAKLKLLENFEKAIN